jgi:hypothetical protein
MAMQKFMFVLNKHLKLSRFNLNTGLPNQIGTKLILIAMQLPKKYKENFDVLSEGSSSGS